MSNQQERPNIEGWIIGFTDGEGCFSASIFQNKTMKSGWQVFPEFVVAQGKKSAESLQIYKEYFQCGKIYLNKRYDNHHEHLEKYCVRSISDLDEKIIPFFKRNPLYTAKQKDFELFVEIVEMLKKQIHLTDSGLRRIALKV
jgi:hypothetical protein